MSGFAGVVSLDAAPPDALLLERMAEALAFRGPDGTHITTKPGAGFCFTFLRTGPAPQCPSQPCSLDGNVWLLGDVRLDGRDDFRRRLEQHGDEFHGEVTDEELVLRAWRRWREDSLPDLIGDYSFALWDAEARKLWCARDLMGARPFFYAQVGNRLYFSNTLNTIRCAPDISATLDHHFIGDFLLQGSCSYPERTAFREISRLPAGHLLSYSHHKMGIRRFISLPEGEPLWLKQQDEYIEQFRELLVQAVADRLPRDSAAIYMSGGLDSTSIAAIAVDYARKHTRPFSLRAYCVDCQPLFDDQEGRLAARVAEHLSIPIEIWSQSSCLPFEGWDENKVTTPEPPQDPYVPSYLQQNRCISRQSRVVFTGYGGDGILTGQAWPYLVYLIRRMRLVAIAMTFGRYFAKHGRFPPLRGGFRALLNRFRRKDAMADYPLWLSPSFEAETHLRERWRELMKSPQKSHPWYPDAHAILNGAYWPEILEREDAGWTKAPLESRAPFLDRRLIHFLLRVPPVPLCVDKELLRRAMTGMLPEEVRLRPKVPLAGDPLMIQVRSGKWSPLPLPKPTASLRFFVDWEPLCRMLANSSGDCLGRDLRPLLLNQWLKGIEKDYAIR
jgi:asparagine synthase (glutamine-hydrolysing)